MIPRYDYCAKCGEVLAGFTCYCPRCGWLNESITDGVEIVRRNVMGDGADMALEGMLDEEDYEMTHRCVYCGAYLSDCMCGGKDCQD